MSKPQRARRQRGSAALEAVLMLPAIVIFILLAADVYLLTRARGDLERRTSTLSSVLAMQTDLTSDGLDGLVSSVLAGHPDHYAIFIGQVWPGGRVAWSLPLGTAKDICADPMAGTDYAGPLPEEDSRPKEEDEEEDISAMLVIETCQATKDIGLTTLSLGTDVLRVRAVSRMQTSSLDMDQRLRRRLGLPDDPV